LQEYQRALQLDPRSADAVIGLAESYESAGRNADAEAAYRKAIALRPDSWSGYNNLGHSCMHNSAMTRLLRSFVMPLRSLQTTRRSTPT